MIARAQWGEFGGVFIEAAQRAEKEGAHGLAAAFLLAALEVVESPLLLRMHLAHLYSAAEARHGGPPDQTLARIAARLAGAQDPAAWLAARSDLLRWLEGAGQEHAAAGFRAIGGAC